MKSNNLEGKLRYLCKYDVILNIMAIGLAFIKQLLFHFQLDFEEILINELNIICIGNIA